MSTISGTPGVELGGGASLLQRAQQLVSNGPEQVRAFEEALRAAESQAPSTGSPSAAGGAGETAPVAGAAETTSTSQVAAAGDTPGMAEKLLSEAEAGHQRLASLLSQLDSGRTFKPRELLRMQTEMHHLVSRLETTSKMLSEVVSGTKNLLQQQV